MDYIINCKEEIEKYGFKLIHFNKRNDIEAFDKDGYKYKLNYSNLKCRKKPNMFMKNPFAVHNIKNEYCDKKRINLIRIKYADFNKIETILDSALQGLLLCEKS